MLPSTTPLLSPPRSRVVVLPPQSLGTGMEQRINPELGDRRLESEFQLCPTFFLHDLGLLTFPLLAPVFIAKTRDWAWTKVSSL